MNKLTQNITHKLASVFVVLTMLLSMLPAGTDISAAPSYSRIPNTHSPSTGLYRTHVTLRQPTDWAHLDKLDIAVLSEGEGWAIVLVDEEQLGTLARLRFQPEASDELGTLVAASVQEKPWLATSLRPLLDQAAALKANSPLPPAGEGAGVRAILHALTPEQIAGITALSSIDDDGDGLTNTEEQWWCTDPLNANSDGDAQGYSDGQEVNALLDFTLPRSVRWGYGPPFGPPNAWPDFNGMDGNPATPACNDGDYDTIPDYAEIFMVGSRVPEESTDHDKFDDGQELFGITYCPGGVTSCGYGSYPRIEYWNYIKASMPAWVLPPGDNIFVAAFPVPEVSVVPGSWTVERVTTITTQQGQMTQATHSYETSVTRGESTSIADTVTWNNWEEVSQAVETPLILSSAAQPTAPLTPCTPVGSLKCRVFGLGKITIGKAISHDAGLLMGASVGCVVLPGIGCLIGGAIGFIGGAVADQWGSEIADEGWSDLTGKNQLQSQQGDGRYPPVYVNVSASANAQASAQVVNNIDFQGVVNSLDGVQYAINQQGGLLARGLYDISYAIQQPRYTETRTQGRSWGGAQTTTHEVYEEHTISEGEAFTTGENWSTAWAVDSSHAANLTFNYIVGNSGTEYARELTGLVFNIYLGDDTTPIISYPAWQQFPNGKLENVFPGAINTFASTAIPLTLEQMKRIDLGDRLTVVLEDYSYGADELFYQDAVNGGVTVFIEDGVDDGDELVDSYVIPTWGTESVQDILTRYFPAGYDLDGNLNSLWTPEFDSINPPAWNEHYLSDIAWWNIYLTQPDAGDTPLKDLSAQAGSALLFRFNRDSDRDGYSDRVEMHYGTDKNDPASHPQPEVLAGYTAVRIGNVVTVKLALENTGTFDAYGIDAVMYAPDDTTSIGNNTVGGNGRVRPSAHVAVGSLVKPPSLTNWGSSTANPYSGGSYAGSADRVYTFSVTTPGVVGQSSAAMSWNDGAGNSGTLDLGSVYHAPLPLDIHQGLQVGFNTGTIMAGSTFTVTALTPRDTFTYTINSEPYTPPVIVVSYSDPQGSHRFITPVELPSLDNSLAPYSGQMLNGLAIEIVPTAPVSATGSNVTDLIFNSPHPATIEDAHLYLNFVSSGTLVAEMPFTFTLQPGPTVYPVSWSTSAFSQTYNSDADNILIAFWTDAQGNIIDSAARPLNTFATDPTPVFAIDDTALTWNFGTATQGQILNHTFTFASTGFVDLLSYADAPSLTVSSPASRRLAPGDTATFTVTLDTAAIAPGLFDQMVTIRTSDPANPTRTVQVTGVITNVAPVAIVRNDYPLDLDVTIPGAHNQGEWITFTHGLGPQPESLHPTMVYSQNGALVGVGKYATSFGQGSASYDMFGDGRDGVMPSNGNLDYNNGFGVGIVNSGSQGSYYINVTDVYAVLRINPGDMVLIHQAQGTNAGCWELNKAISDFSGGTATYQLAKPLQCNYSSGGSNRAQILRVPQYTDCPVSGTVTPLAAWNGTWGGIFAVMCKRTMNLTGSINANGWGFRGGVHSTTNSVAGQQGEGWPGSGNPSQDPNGNGGGGGGQSAGGGGGNGSPGQRPRPDWGGTGGYAAGNPELTNMHFGGGGGGAAWEGGDPQAGDGGRGGAIVVILAGQLTVNGSLVSNGQNGQSLRRGGGGGSGGSILIKAQTADLGITRVEALGGSGGITGIGGEANGGAGGTGRIRIEYCESLSSSTNPPASTQKLNCYIVEQIESAPYNSAHLNLPESFTNGRTYKVQYGRRLVFSGAGELTTTLRVRAGSFANAALDALVSDVSAGSITFMFDVGNDGLWDWQTTQNVTSALTLNSPDLAMAFNQYWIAHGSPLSDTLDVPIRVSLNNAGQVILTNMVMTPTPPDIALNVAGITLSNASPTESDAITVTATLTNTGSLDTGGLTTAFYATNNQLPATSNQWYIGSAFVPNIPAGGTAQAIIRWDTTGFTGTVPAHVVADPFNRVAETNEANNAVTITLSIRTRPDLSPVSFTLLDDEPNAGDLVTVTLGVRNSGQTATGTFTTTLYDGNPSTGGALIGAQSWPALSGTTQVSLTFTWVPTSPGLHTLFAGADSAGQVNEYDESNNQTIQPVYVGFHSPILLDSGSASDPSYTSTLGYGYVDIGQPDVSVNCGSQSYETLRMDPSGRVAYRFDHLLPGHFYHLDLMLYECDSAGRQESIYVDGNLIAGPEDLGDGRLHRLSLRLDPALYADRTISATVEAPGIDGAVVGAVNLYDIDYRYADAGGTDDPQYPGGHLAKLGLAYGWLDGVNNTNWGTLPYQSVRVNQGGNTVHYRFNGLDPSRQYEAHLNFWQPSGATRIFAVQIDGNDTGLVVNTGDYQAHQETVSIPADAYADDHTAIVGIVRTNGTTGAFVNEIALEEVTMVAPPVADFTASPVSGYAPLVVQFTDHSSGTITSRLWNFGDDSAPDIHINPVHIYNSPGAYTVTLTAYGPGGSHTLAKPNYITVTTLPPNATVVRIVPTTVSANVGSPVTVAVAISNVANLGSFQFTMNYSPSLATAEAATLGEFPGSSGRPFGPIGPVISDTAGTVAFGASSLGSVPGPNGSGTLAYVRLLPRSKGTTVLSLTDVQVANVAGTTIPAIIQGGMLVITGSIRPVEASITKSVAPQGQVNYHDELTYTLVISATPGQQLALYDPLTGTTFMRFVEQPGGIVYAGGIVTGMFTLASSQLATVTFVARVEVPTVGPTASVANRACVYLPPGTVGACQWSNQVSNLAVRSYSIFLPVVLRSF